MKITSSWLCRLWLFASIFLLCSFGNAHAFDGERKGFILGGGIGLGMTSFTQSLGGFGERISGDRETKPSFVTDFKIGGGVSEQVLLYWTSRVSWFSLENILADTVTIASGTAGVGVTYFPNPESNFYLLGGLGLATWGTPFESGTSPSIGLALLGGIGFELSPHWTLDITLSIGNSSDTVSGIELTNDVGALLVTFNGIAF